MKMLIQDKLLCEAWEDSLIPNNSSIQENVWIARTLKIGFSEVIIETSDSFFVVWNNT